MKVKFGTEAYITHANLGLGWVGPHGWPFCRFCSGSAMLIGDKVARQNRRCVIGLTHLRKASARDVTLHETR